MKRGFRSKKRASQQTGYPTFREGRRAFLQQLGGLVAGGALASVLGACGERAVGDDPPADGGGGREAGFETSGGVADVPAAPVDMYPPPDTGEPWVSDGVAPPMDMGLPPSSESIGGMADAFPASVDLQPPDGGGD